MDTGQADHHLAPGTADRRRRGLLFAGLFALGLGYVGAFAFFLANSVDFVARQQREAALAAAAALAPTLPAALAFGAGDSGAALLGPGWHRPESAGTWSRDREATVQLPAAARGASWLILEFEAHIERDRGALEVRLELEDQALAVWRPTAAAPVVNAKVRLPSAGSAATTPALRFRIDKPSSPRQSGLGEDARPLGIHLRRIELLAAEGDASQPPADGPGPAQH